MPYLEMRRDGESVESIRCLDSILASMAAVM